MNYIRKWHTDFADLTDFHGFRNNFIWNMRALLLVSLISNISAQEVTDEELYSILFQQVRIYSEIEPFAEEENILLNQAVSYADSGDHQVAVIYLEELLAQLPFLNNKTDILKAEEYPFKYDIMPISHKAKKSSRFRLSAITGIDYNRQEFEISYFENDSAILEQINRPYVGFFAGFIYQFNPVYSLEITNSLRYDKDYLRNDYRIIWRAGTGITLQYNGYWNQSEIVLASSFWEHEIDARFFSRINPTFAVSIQNNFRHKTWSGITAYISDYNRNRFFAVADWQRFRLEYINELNESLGTEELDYLQHSIRIGLRNQPGWQLTYDLEMDLTMRNYSLAFEDSIVNNLYHQAGINLYCSFPMNGLIKLVAEDNFIYKSYDNKSSLEPDYIWNFFRPGLVLNMENSFDVTLGYEWEFRTHHLVSNDIFDVSEQNYNSDGIFLSLSYFNTTGSYFSASVSYQWRRYPQSATNDILSLYSNRNILSVTAMANWPLLTNLLLNTYIMFDNDQDIDLDQQNNHSTIITAELEYKF